VVTVAHLARTLDRGLLVIGGGAVGLAGAASLSDGN
jgi:hypothetical protein